MITTQTNPTPAALTEGILANKFLQKGSAILDKLVFWGRLNPDGFWKLQEPCPHPLYKEGDSWTEEIGCSVRQFREEKKKICTSYSSETAFWKESDPFKGKPIACFFNRAKKMTWYFLNEENLKKWHEGERMFTGALPVVCRSAAGRKIQSKEIKYIPPKSPLPESLEVGSFKIDSEDLEKEISELPEPEIKLPETEKTAKPVQTSDILYNPSKKAPLIRRERIIKKQRDHRQNRPRNPIQAKEATGVDSQVESTTKPLDLPPEALKTANEMDGIWRKQTNGLIKTPKLSPHMALRLFETFKNSFSSSLEQWESYCKRIGSSKFLTGQTQSSFQLWLVRAIKPETIEKIRSGEYGVDSSIELGLRVEPPEREEEAMAEIEKEIRSVSDNALELNLRLSLLESHGSKTHNSWFKDLHFHESDGSLEILCPSPFKANWIETRFKNTFEIFLKTHSHGLDCLKFKALH